jgi:hypothetical protein
METARCARSPAPAYGCYHANVKPARLPTPPYWNPPAKPAFATTLLLIRACAIKLMALVPRKLPQLVVIAKRLLSGSAEPLMAIATAVPS